MSPSGCENHAHDAGFEPLVPLINKGTQATRPRDAPRGHMMATRPRDAPRGASREVIRHCGVIRWTLTGLVVPNLGSDGNPTETKLQRMSLTQGICDGAVLCAV